MNIKTVDWIEKLILGKKGNEIVLTTDKDRRFKVDSEGGPGLPYRLYSDVVERNNVSTDETTFGIFTVNPEIIPEAGQYIRVFGSFHCTNSLGTKVLKAYIDAIELADITSIASAALAQIAEVDLIRKAADVIHAHIRLFDADGATGVLGTQWSEFHEDISVEAGGPFVFKFTGTAAASNRHNQDSLIATVFP